VGKSRRQTIYDELAREPRVWQCDIVPLIDRATRRKDDIHSGMTESRLSRILKGRQVLGPAMYDAILAAIKEVRARNIRIKEKRHG
jgi:hypothetical protein